MARGYTNDDPLDRPGSSRHTYAHSHASSDGGGRRGGAGGGRGRGSGSRGGRGGVTGRGRGSGSSGPFGPAFPLQQRPQRHFNADYTHVTLDYDRINRQGYARMEGFGVSVMPFGEKGQSQQGSSITPGSAGQAGGSRGRGRGGFGAGRGEAERGRGRGRGGGRGQYGSPFQGRSGYSTPTPNAVTWAETPSRGRSQPNRGRRGGLGSFGAQSTRGPASGLGRPSTVGQGLDKTGRQVTWGGGGAPMFVKGGELFKDGEVDHDLEVGVEVSGVGKAPFSLSTEVAEQGREMEVEEDVEVLDITAPAVPAFLTSSRSIVPASPPALGPFASQAMTAFDLLEQAFPSAPSTAAAAAHTHPTAPTVFPGPLDPDSPITARAMLGPHPDRQSEVIDLSRQNSTAGSVSPKPSDPSITGNAPPADPIVEAEHRLTDFIEAGPAPLATLSEQPSEPTSGQSQVSQTALARSIPSSPDIEEVAFIVDTAPSDLSASRKQGRGLVPLYERISDLTLGSVAPDQSTSVSRDPVHTKAAVRTVSEIVPIPAYIDPRVSARPGGASKKATKRQLKKEKRQRQKQSRSGAKRKGAKRSKEQMIVDSDLEWGSDGPPLAILDVMGAASDSDSDSTSDVVGGVKGHVNGDVAVLRDYLAGALLGQVGDEGTTDAEEDERLAELLGIPGAAALDGADETGNGDITALDSGEEESPAVEWESEDAGSQAEEEEVDSSELGDLMAALDEEEGSESGSESEEDEEEARGETHRGLGSKATRGSRGNPIAISESGSDSDLGSDSEDEEDDEIEVDKMFRGKDSWDETAWFLQTVESALDGGEVVKGAASGGQKAKKTNGKGLEMGNYSDEEWQIHPIKRKDKKKIAHLPPELQLQWEKDRQTKARRREQRQLDRMAALLDLSASAGLGLKAGKGKKGKGKGKQKANLAFDPRSNKLGAAKRAHLLPGSAAEVAELFDVSSDDGADPVLLGATGMSGGRRLRAMAGLSSLSAADEHGLLQRGGVVAPPSRLEKIDRLVRQFLTDDRRETLSLPPMDKEERKKLHLLAECYGLKSKSSGKGKARYTVFSKTARTSLPSHSGAGTVQKLERLLLAGELRGGQFYKALHAGRSSGGGAGGGGGGGGGKKGRSGEGGSATAARMREGEKVGEGAERIGEGNIGHRLLSQMGWKEGGRIGRMDGGLEAPIVAIVKTTKMGLGA